MTWQEHLRTLENSHWASVKLMIDGYEVTYQNETYKRKVVVSTYVNGYFKGIWVGKEGGHPESRFFKPMFYKPGKKELEIEKMFCKARRVRYNQKDYIQKKTVLICYSPNWPSAKAIISHIKKQQFKSIEILNP